jgi:hypothetical protein
MSIHSKRHRKARMIQAKADSLKAEMIRAESGGVEWIQAADAPEGQAKPKKFTIKAYSGGILRVSRYDVGVVIDLQGLAIQTPVPCLLDHESTEIVGHADEANKTASSLAVSGVVSGVGDAADKVVAMAANGFPWRASVGALPSELEWVGEGVSVSVNGKSFKGPLYVARKSELKEVSFVAVAADSRTSVKVAATAAQYKEHDMDFGQWIEAMGLVLAELRDDQRAKLQAKYDGEVNAAKEIAAKAAKEIEASGNTETPPAPKIEAPKFDLSGVVLAHEKHIAAIEAKAAEWTPKIADTAKLAEIRANGSKAAADLKLKALNEEWAVPRLEAEHIKAAAMVEVELMRAERPAGPAIHASNRDVIYGDVLSAAILASGRIAKPEDHCTEASLNAAHKAFPRGIGLQEMIVAAARANGWGGYSFKQDASACMRFAFSPIQAGGFSTVAITGILSNIANKFLLEGFTFTEQAWREIASTRSVSDFKTTTSYRMTGATTYKLVPPSGEIPHGTLGEESYTNKADTYGLMLAITRTDVINDDLGAISSVPRNLGTGAGRTLNHIFWTVYLGAQTTLFTAGRANYFSGASSALAIDALSTAEQMFMDLKDADSQPIGHTPAILLTPTGLSATAAALNNSTEIRDTTASTKYPVNNPHKGKFRPVVSRYMGNSSYTGYSTTAWNLLADPREVSTVEVCFLNGQQSPTVEQADADFDTLGVQMRGYFDFGVNEQDYRGGVRSAGV